MLTERKSAGAQATAAICGVKVVDTQTGAERVINGDTLILACGHSAPDIYRMIAAVDNRALEAKTFAVGVRVEHPREVIDKIQYHGKERGKVLPAAEYRLTAQVQETVIKALDGYTYRGRKLTVSYSKKKSEMTEDYEPAQNDSLPDNDSADAARFETAESNGGNSEFLV